MNKLATLMSAAFAIMAPTPSLAIEGGRYGDVHLVVPNGPIQGYVVLFSGQDGWSDANQAALAALGQQGALAVGVDTKTYLARLTEEKEPCHNLVGDVEILSRRLQREHSGLQYHFPILAGVDAGGTLAGAILAQAPVNTVAGAVSVDPSVVLPSERPLCAGAPSSPQPGGFAYGPSKVLQGFWNLGLTAAEPKEARTYFASLQSAGMPMSVQSVPGSASDAVTSLVQPHFDAGDASGLSALPLIELPASHPTGQMAIVLSGDGGWRDLDKTIAEELQSRGVSVVGWDSVRYFWEKKTPEQTAADLAAVIRAYGEKWHAKDVALVGYSFGADVLPFVYNDLAADIKSRIAQISLLGFANAADWEIQVAGWLGAAPSSEAVPVGPAIEQVPAKLLQCFYGNEETDTFCNALSPRGVEVIKTTGGHHFDGNYARMAEQILDGFNKRVAARM
ncbi:virulence factor family protein [Mesorhizobium sp. CU2]|uniref:virulence factor family protein n=1 Tax=unclassified Mesorhizobium TaxID=325217 RepID=UPI00112E39FC|nr:MULTISPECIES: AcvB/VirJ family lysyl-phosphatidylglycerol hydrolase [unclassified Mesorhizobium]TPN83221.1 virulence factor family protein [Mesorhizobium sp. CU3]TPO12233.1 virulence factor family protein [Mesorhizobium sp. CU2]